MRRSMEFKSLADVLLILALATAPYHVMGQPAGQPVPSTSGPRLGELRASELIGKGITDMRGENLGEIKDFLVDLKRSKVQEAVLDFGGALGLGEKQYAFPVTALQRGKAEGKFMLNVARSELASAGSTRSPRESPDLTRASTVIGMAVEDAERRKVGNVRDFIANLDSGLIRSFVIDIENDRAEAVVAPDSLSASHGDKLMVDRSRDELIRDAEAARAATSPGEAGARFR